MRRGPFSMRGGNQVPLPLSFVVDGEAIEVCVTWQRDDHPYEACRVLDAEVGDDRRSPGRGSLLAHGVAA